MDRDTFEKLQQEAEKRVINQQKKESSYAAKSPGRAAQSAPYSNGTQDTCAQNSNEQKNSPLPHSKPLRRQSKELINLLNLKNIALDSERALIMGIILLLANDDADEWLILSLIYIML